MGNKLERYIVVVDFKGTLNYLQEFVEHGTIFSSVKETAKVFHKAKAEQLAEIENKCHRAWIEDVA